MPEDKWYTPLNLIWLGTYLRQFDYDVEILDGQILSVEQIINKICAPVIGISFDVLSVYSFNKICKVAYEKGSLVVAGGQYATPLSRQILSNNQHVDYVIRYDGEKALKLLLDKRVRNKNIELFDIPNLVWKNEGEIVFNEIVDEDINTFPIPDRSLEGININNYINNFQETKESLLLPFNYQRPTNTFSIKGCPRRKENGGCSFCSRVEKKVRCKRPEKVFEEYRYLVNEYKIDYISDFSDNWILPKWLKQLVDVYDINGGITAKLRIYGDIRDINEKSVALLKMLGVETVLLGIESGNEEVLRKNGKPYTKEQILKSIHLLGKNNIKISEAYMLGLMGETRKSIKDTIALSNEIKELCDVEISYWNILTPLPGAKCWSMIMGIPSIRDKYNNEYDFDTVALEKAFIENFSCLGYGGYEYLLDIRNQMLEQALIPSREYIPKEQKNIDFTRNISIASFAQEAV